MIDEEANTRRRRDPIVEGIREMRQQHAAQFDYDPEAIFDDLKRYRGVGGFEVVSFPARRLEKLGDGAA